MPPTYSGNAATSLPNMQSPEVEVMRGAVHGGEGSPSTSEGSAIAPQTAGSQRKVDKQSLDYILRSGLAGGLAGCAVRTMYLKHTAILTVTPLQAKTLVGPLDRVKILFQASNPQFAKYTGSWFGVIRAMRDINQQDGLRGLFRGHSATLLRIFPYAAIKFLAYEQIRSFVIRDKSQETPVRRLVSGSLAGITSVFFTYPLEVIRVRLAFETKHDSKSSFIRICKQIYHERPSTPYSMVHPATTTAPSSTSASLPTRAAASTLAATSSTIQAVTPRSGLANFYRGFSPTLLGMLPYAGMSFLTHDTVGDWLRHPSIARWTTVSNPSISSASTRNVDHQSSRPRLTNAAELVSGALAGLVSQTSSYPLEVIRRRMQVGGAVGDGHRLRMGETIRRIWVERGVQGFFVGLSIGYLKVVPMVAVSFWVYERTKLALGI